MVGTEYEGQIALSLVKAIIDNWKFIDYTEQKRSLLMRLGFHPLIRIFGYPLLFTSNVF